jgi:PIN domain nuclease of toxin-antitoxin system
MSMKILLDTHVLLWVAGDPNQLSAQARKLLEDPQNQLYFSAASLWEISIKNKLGRTDFKVDLPVLRRNLLDYGFEEIAINSAHILAVEALPNVHKDPFDRMLVAQTIAEGITLMTSDAAVAEYPVAVIRI